MIADIFSQFASESGLNINIAKSRAFDSSKVTRQKKKKINTSALDKYLGFPMLKGRVKKADFDFIVDKVQGRLASWKNKLLNKVRKLTLAKLVMSSIPTYYMQVSWLPQSICDQIDRLTEDFIWKGANEKGIHLVGWKTITKLKSHTGNEMRLTRESNTTMLGKVVWDIHSNCDKLWVNVLKNKYLDDTPILLSTNRYGSTMWNEVC